MTPMQIAARKHRDADMLRSGHYGEMDDGFHACSIGCFAYEVAPEQFSAKAGWMDDNQHRIVAEAYGYPEWLARLQDTVFEGLPPEAHLDWHVQIADAIAERKRDWQTILHAIHASILRISYRTAGSASDAVRTVLDLHERAAEGEAIPDKEWNAACRSVESAPYVASENAGSVAAWRVVENALESATESATWKTVDNSAASAAESAAASVVWSMEKSVESAPGRSAYVEIRDGILAELVREP